MTTEKKWEAARSYARGLYDEWAPEYEIVRDAHISGSQMVLQSEEYRLLVHEARLWRRHQEVINNGK